MSHEFQDEVSLELARQVAARLRESTGPLELARGNVQHWCRLNAQSKALLRCYGEWQSILDRPLDEICDTLCADTEEGRRLRQNSPFAGVLPPKQVWEIKRRYRELHKYAAISA